MKGSIALALVLALGDAPKRNRRRKWSKKWFLRRNQLGHARLLRELRDDEPDDYRNFLRMDAASYDELLNLVRPIIQKKDTIMREAISANERLSITLRFLATGNSFEDLKFITRTSPQAIGKIVFETCEAITQCLQRQQAIKVKTIECLIAIA
ncbi:hypothetical protein HOLleu_11928 [Holothuria leucospilota]|uniref:Uncharacterized protein n=1 Tax=Holothuria leucospilota TaxID=206669 RepID=A0A9Q1H9S3_HOLLE|nr:hypothetical protein HOLleu_11928 [Holothuria leucospilota]